MAATVTIDKRAAVVNFKYQRGDTVAEPITILEAGSPANLTGRVYRAQLRKRANAAASVQFVITIATPATGQMVLHLDHDTTSELSGTYFWDLEQDISGVVRTLIRGDFVFDPDTTRSD
jgi:hypothetical protein